jgi:hypothetical protein
MTTGINVEGFVIDSAFVDQSKAINGILVDDSVNVASLTQKALKYFNVPEVFADTRLPNTRDVNWVATTNPKIVVDQTSFGDFITTVNALGTPITQGLFKIVDKLIFKYNSAVSHATLETFLTTDVATSGIYIPGTFQVATRILTDTVYLSPGITSSVQVPVFVRFSIVVPSGSTTKQYDLTLFVAADEFITGYSESTIVAVVPPLSYNTIYSASLVAAVDNVFATGVMSANLSYNTSHVVLGNTTVSGMVEYNVILTDASTNTVAIPFNILYKGRSPSGIEIRTAVRNAVLASGIGDQTGWKSRIPGLFVLGRFYIIPLWDKTYTKPDQVLFPNITKFSDMNSKTNEILQSLAYGDVSSYIDVFSAYYNKMLLTAVPDMSGALSVYHLSQIIPDYQDFSPTEDNYSYMNTVTKNFSSAVNTILALETNNQTSTSYYTTTENLLTFYSFTVGEYEMCVITKLCYDTIMESVV